MRLLLTETMRRGSMERGGEVYDLGPGYEESADVLRALTPYVFLAGLAPLVSLAVNFLGEARRRIPIALGAVAVNVAIDVTLIPRIGIVAGAIGTRYIAQLKLQSFNQGSKGRFGFLGLRIVETQHADVRLFLTIWDSRDGSIAWEAMQELRIARESTTERPLMLRKMLEHSARELIARLP
jgi:heme-degrading monooxygenase HmoA